MLPTIKNYNTITDDNTINLKKLTLSKAYSNLTKSGKWCKIKVVSKKGGIYARQ